MYDRLSKAETFMHVSRYNRKTMFSLIVGKTEHWNGLDEYREEYHPNTFAATWWKVWKDFWFAKDKKEEKKRKIDLAIARYLSTNPGSSGGLLEYVINEVGCASLRDVKTRLQEITA